MDKITFGVNYKVDFGKDDYHAIPDSVILTRSQLEELLGNAFDAGERHEMRPNSYPEKQEYITSIINTNG